MAVGVRQLREVEDVGSSIGSPLRAKSCGKLSVASPVMSVKVFFGAQAVRGSQLVVVRHAVVAPALDVDRAQVLDTREALGLDGRRGAGGRIAAPRLGIWNRMLRSELSICSSLLYCGSPPRPCSSGPSPTAGSRSGLPNARLSGIASSIWPSSSSTSMPCLLEQRRAGRPGRCSPARASSNSPWIMLCAR